MTPTPESQQAALKPCPFCGSPAELENASDHHGEWFNLGCSRHWGRVKEPERSCIGSRVWYTEPPEKQAEAIALWNTRANPVSESHAALPHKAQNWLDEARFFLARLPVLMPESTAEGIRTTHDLLNRAAELILTALRAHPAGGVSEDHKQTAKKIVECLKRVEVIDFDLLEIDIANALRAAGIGAGVVPEHRRYMDAIDADKWGQEFLAGVIEKRGLHGNPECRFTDHGRSHHGDTTVRALWKMTQLVAMVSVFRDDLNFAQVTCIEFAAAPSHDKGQ